MSETRFRIHRPKTTMKIQNTDSVECTLSVEDGVTRIKCESLDGFDAELVLAYDGYKIIVVLKDSEGYMEHLKIYKGV